MNLEFLRNRILYIISFVIIFGAPKIVLASKGKRMGPLPSQTPPGNVPRLLSKAPSSNVKIGTWVEYLVTQKGRKQPFKMKIGFAGREAGGRQTWIEIHLRQISQTIYIKMLFDGKPGANFGKARRVIFKFGQLQAMEAPLKNVRKKLPMLFRKPMVKPKIVGNVDVRTKAGSFPGAMKVAGVDADGGLIEVYSHKQVFLWGLLKFAGPRVTMELIGQGTGFRTRITEKPAPFSLPK